MAQLMSELLEKKSDELRQRFFSSVLPQSVAQWHDMAADRMLDAFPVGIAFLDEHLVLRYQNRTYAEYLESYSAGGSMRAEGRCFFDYLPGSRAWTENSFRYVKDSKSTLIEHDHEIRLKDGDGEKQSFWNANLAAMIHPDRRLAGVVIVCQDISFEKGVLGQLARLERQVETLTQQMQDARQAIRFLTEMHSEDQRLMQENLSNTISTVVFPLLEHIRKNKLNDDQHSILDVVFSTLSNLAADIGPSGWAQKTELTPKETRIHTMVKAGKTTKEISEILCVSTSTVSFHRGNIRRKLGPSKNMGAFASSRTASSSPDQSLFRKAGAR